MSQYWKPRRSGKTVYMLQRSALDGIAILVTSEKNRLALLETAKRLGIENHIRIVSPSRAQKGVTYAGVIVDEPYKKPWIDKRPEAEQNKKIGVLTREDIEHAMRELDKRPYYPRYIFRARAMGKTPYSDEEVIAYFKGTGVVVEDSKGNRWFNGKPYEANIT